MRLYSIILGDILIPENDKKFSDFVMQKRFDYWRYTPLHWILLTPDDVFTNQLVHDVYKAYGNIVFCVLEISIKDVGGMFPMYGNIPASKNLWTPFHWFENIKRPDFVPKWLQPNPEPEKNK
ncbi:hypothetical protein [Pedobacter sp.]|uniref:hypothetical protein n=1 Tax=Pedobacter sp. TaxID=1411316 RepID=UPI0031D67851